MLTDVEQDIFRACAPTPHQQQQREFDVMKALRKTPLKHRAEQSSADFFQDKFMLGLSDDRELCPVEWEVVSSKGMMRWEELRHEKETNGGKSLAHDMYYAFQLLPWSPAIKQGGDTLKYFMHLWNKVYPDVLPCIPDLHTLKRIKGKDALTNGMWLILVRVPRPCHGKPHIPLCLRKDFKQFPDESSEDWLTRKAELKRREDSEHHPAEAQLYLTQNMTLIQEVGKHIVCAKCGAKGHHHEKSHDDVYSPALEPSPITCFRVYPQWMNVLPYPQESIVLTKLLEEEKGLTLQIRETETKIPLRLARKLLMDGLIIEGAVYASGVGTRKRVRREEEEESDKKRALENDREHELSKAKLQKTTEPLKLSLAIPLYIDLHDEDRMHHEYIYGLWESFSSGTIPPHLKPLTEEEFFKNEF
jgi:hypothetical protein